MVLPSDTITFSKLYLIEGNYLAISNNSTITILGMAITPATSVKATIYCGTTKIHEIKISSQSNYIYTNLVCNQNINIETYSNADVEFLINYVPYNNYSVSTSTPIIYAGFSQGDLLIAYFLFIIMIGSVFGFFVKNFIFNRRNRQ